MNAKQAGLEAVLFGFSALTAYAVYQHGYIGFFEMMLSNAVTITAFADLIISLGLIILWMRRDARDYNIALFPYIIMTIALGSVGPLLYLIRRFGKEPRRLVRPQEARI